jgi:hypothetical protein
MIEATDPMAWPRDAPTRHVIGQAYIAYGGELRKGFLRSVERFILRVERWGFEG